MIIHIWMHWFWITMAYFKGPLFFRAQMVSLTCISLQNLAEAGLLENSTSFPPVRIVNDSSLSEKTNVTLLPTTTSHDVSITSLPEGLSNETTPKQILPGSTSDLEDTHNGGSLETFQYPLKKVAKYSHLKYGKVKGKGKPNNETIDDDRIMEPVKMVEEKVNLNISIDGTAPSEGFNKSEARPSQGTMLEVATTDPVDLMTTGLTIGSEEEMSVSNETLGSIRRDELVRRTNVTNPPSTRTGEIQMKLAEDQREVEDLKNDTLVIENKVAEGGVGTTAEPFFVKNRVAAATSAQNYEEDQAGLNAGSITGITLGILVIFSLFGAVSFVLYRRRYLNKPQVLHDKCSNLDSSGYIDETSLRENSEEMYSLDNDSFLNSLEAMTIQNYWTENVKHTKL